MTIDKFMDLLNGLTSSDSVEIESEIQVDVPDSDGYFEETFVICGVTVNNNGSISLKLFKPEKE